MTQSTQNIAISGYYGCGNAGDEAVLAGIKQAIRQRGGKQVSLTVLSQNPQATTELHGIPAVHRMNLREVRDSLKKNDLLISGGGSLLQDTTSLKSLLYYLLVARMALHYKVPLMFYAQGMGPFHRPISRFLVKRVANRAAAITVRDEPSAELLRKIGVTRPIEVTADPAFALNPADDKTVNNLWLKEGMPITSRPIIGVALRGWGTDREAQASLYARLIEQIEEQTDAVVCMVPMQVPEDVKFSELVLSKTNCPADFALIRNSYPPETLLGVIKQMSMVVAMRLHTLIFAARAAVPLYALSYDPKVASLMNLLEQEDCLSDWKDFDPSDVASRVRDIMTDSDVRWQALTYKGNALELRALRNAEIALNTMKK